VGILIISGIWLEVPFASMLLSQKM
jgi:hypothetical protein